MSGRDGAGRLPWHGGAAYGPPMTRRLLAAAAAAALLVPAAALGVGEPPPAPTEIAKDISLRDAASRGMVKLTSKGGFGGDTVAVDLNWKPSPGPAHVRIKVEFVADFGGDAARRTQFSNAAKTAVDNGVKELNRFVAKGGGAQKLDFSVDYIVSDRSSPPTPGYHRVEVIKTNDPNYRSGLDEAATPNDPNGVSGTWSTDDLFDAKVFAHEAFHLAGLPDRYEEVYREPGKTKAWPAPRDLDTTKKIDDWAKAHVPPLKPGGELTSVPQKGAGCDVMANEQAACARLRPKDINALLAQAGVRLKADPGDLLANKDSAAQDLGVGAPLSLFAPRGGKAHVDGLIAYCINLSAHIPQQGVGLDVVGPATQLGPGFAQLDAVLKTIAARATDDSGSVLGGQQAVWAVTNQSAGYADEAREVLNAAGITGETGLGTGDLPNANAGSAETGAVGFDGGVVPPPAPEPEPPAAVTVLLKASLSQTVIRPRKARLVTVTLDLTGPETLATLTVERKAGKRWRALKALPPVPVAGSSYVDLVLPKLSKGTYRVRVTGAFSAKAAPFVVARTRG